MVKLKQIIGDYEAFLTDILGRVKAEGFDLKDFVQIDHMCYRAVSLENYESKKAELLGVAELLGETMVNGRPIATFRLNNPVIFKEWRIDAVELPAPKENDTHKERLEHIEFVIFDDMQKFLKKYNKHPFNLQSVDRGINPEVGLKLGDCSVKFHLLNLPTVVYLEHKLNITEVKNCKST